MKALGNINKQKNGYAAIIVTGYLGLLCWKITIKRYKWFAK